jgi:hypothetical protein
MCKSIRFCGISSDLLKKSRKIKKNRTAKVMKRKRHRNCSAVFTWKNEKTLTFSESFERCCQLSANKDLKHKNAC